MCVGVSPGKLINHLTLTLVLPFTLVLSLCNPMRTKASGTRDELVIRDVEIECGEVEMASTQSVTRSVFSQPGQRY